ncbi:PRC-barrel domain-containing protein [Streptomyces sp. W1SF4]|uniref:PRC-barrel domain-containing protein n=1 Tax=Streptomyces sp. W1SF4 TaxID=2305220 RepID=UPI000F6D0536|nr:PRC-barrel domain-containing protein [Streptomyces sp. W1SF4]AZM87159.1 PRC-barrel domain containing protein [Streptomyces sp. W1SF4]
MNNEMWSYVPTAGHGPDDDLTGYRVEAADGHIGKVGKHSDEVADQYIVVDTGVWIFGKDVLLPASTVTAIDNEERRILVSLTKEQIKNAPEFDKEKHLGDPAYRDQLGGYYGGSGH